MKGRPLKVFKAMLLVIVFIPFLACNNRQETAGKESSVEKGNEPPEIPYTLAKNYFVRNDFDASKLLTPKITTQEAFEKIFGMATVMGAEGKPTPIDFSEQFVIAVILPVSNKSVELKVQQLLQDHDQITLRYTQHNGQDGPMKVQAFLLLIVDKKYDRNVVVEQAN